MKILFLVMNINKKLIEFLIKKMIKNKKINNNKNNKMKI